jgi:hypothetical protein
MTEAQWRRVRDLFERVLQENPPRLSEWLDREGVADAEVRAEVESLLAHHSRAGAFLTDPVAERLPQLLSEDRTLEPGQVVGFYTILREAGRGGMGRVYAATDSRLGRTVALKAIRPGMTADPVQRERLRREARAAAALEHPGICTVYALEEFDGELFIASEFVDGHTLRDEITRGLRPSVDEAMSTAREIGAALASAHARGITHRDLKPENVMRTRDGRLKILDFGLARVDGPQTDPLAVRVTEPSVVAGTPSYMAPEQLNSWPIDARVDVFAFGVLMYEYTSGAHPFAAPTPLAVIGRVLESEPTPIARVVPQLPAPLTAVIVRCLKKAPGARFASAAEIVEALESGDAPPAVPMNWWRTHQLVIMALYVVASVLAWQIKEWFQGAATAAFIAICIAAVVGGVFRGHLVFTERVNRAALTSERLRTRRAVQATDVLMAVTLAIDGLLVAPTEQLLAVVTLGLAIGILLANLVLEPATTVATFGPDHGDGTGRRADTTSVAGRLERGG